MYFASDNGTGASSKIIEAVAKVMAEGPVSSYGADALTEKVEQDISALFERDVAVFFMTSGTAANALGLAHIVPPWGAIFAHEEAHIITSECGAPEFYSSAKLVGLPGVNGKLTPHAIDAAIDYMRIEDPHGVQPAAVSITNLTECGTLYTPQEIQSLSGAAKKHAMKLHLDGARFSNAVAALKCSPADLAWRAGVDIMSFGATKNGAIAAEALIFFDPAAAKDFKYRRMRGGHLVSKHRFLAAQYDAWLSDNHWLEMANHANAMANKLSAGLQAVGVRLAFPCEGNEIFALLDKTLQEQLKNAGVIFYDWSSRNYAAPKKENEQLARLVCGFSTAEQDVDALLKLLEGLTCVA